VDGLLVMPPYLVDCGQSGLRDHYLRLAGATDLDLIVYQRDNAVFTPETVAELAGHPRIVGFKDGRGDLDLMRRIVGAVRERHGDGAVMYFNGMPTAEAYALPYRSVGVTAYSSAVFCFAPDIALGFHRAYRDGDDATVEALLDGFFRPYVQLRLSGTGYAVSLVKAGTGDAGGVRAPLSDPLPEHVTRLAELVRAGRALLTGGR
jgi:5-dehydro-4-deoxyglucarate dehydratase